MFTKIFGVIFLGLTGLGLLGVATVSHTIMGLLAIAWAISWLANA